MDETYTRQGNSPTKTNWFFAWEIRRGSFWRMLLGITDCSWLKLNGKALTRRVRHWREFVEFRVIKSSFIFIRFVRHWQEGFGSERYTVKKRSSSNRFLWFESWIFIGFALEGWENETGQQKLHWWLLVPRHEAYLDYIPFESSDIAIVWKPMFEPLCKYNFVVLHDLLVFGITYGLNGNTLYMCRMYTF